MKAMKPWIWAAGTAVVFAIVTVTIVKMQKDPLAVEQDELRKAGLPSTWADVEAMEPDGTNAGPIVAKFSAQTSHRM